MSQIPPYPPYGAGQPYPPQFRPPRTSAAAVASLVMGLLGCLPFVTGVFAIITGVIGIAVTARPQVKGRGMAIAGLCLGILSLLSWTGIGVGAWRWWVLSAPERVVAQQFVSDLSQGNTASAAAASTSHLTAAQLDAASKKLLGWGSVQRTRIVFANPYGQVSGIVVYPNNQYHSFVAGEVQQNGAWKIDSFVLQQ
jgi:hypothetical protein